MVAGADVLRVFQMVPEVISKLMRTVGIAELIVLSLLMSLNPKAMPEPAVDGEDIEPRLKLECVASWRLFGWVQVGGASTVSYFSSLTSNSTEHGKCAADWWGERFTFVGLQECKALSCRVQVRQLVIPRKYFSISAPRSMT